MNRKVIIVAILIVLVGVGVFLLGSNLNSLVAKVIEGEGTKVTDTNVSVSGVNIKLRDGSGSIDDLRIASPDGYKSHDAFTLGNITVDIDVKTVTDDPVVIEEIRISAPVVHAEFTKTGASNIDEIRKRVQAFSGGGTSGGGGEGASGGSGKRIRISRFVFEKGRIDVDASALGVEARTLDLPEISLTNVGGSGGATPDKIAQEIIGAVARKVTSEIASNEVDRLIKKQLGDESLTDKAKGLLDKVTN